MEFVEEEKGLLVFKGETILPDTKLLFLDYDGTIIRQKNGKIPRLRKENDWVFVSKNVRPVLENWEGVCIIITNQKGLSGDKRHGFVEQITDVLYGIEFKYAPWVLVATEDNNYRKPSTGTIEYLSIQSGRVFNKQLYVGDACGRPKDHSSCDIHLAINLGWRFETPEMFFDKASNNIPTLDVDLSSIKVEKMSLPLIPDDIRILFLQGPPASGKSTLCKKLSDFYVINQDELKTLPKCIKIAREKLNQGCRLVIDRTNPDLESMSKFMELAPSSCGILSVKIDKWMNNHLNHFRAHKSAKPKIPTIAYNIYHKKYQKPTEEMGFKWIGEIEWKMEQEQEGFRRYYF